ncbi:MAG: ATP-binding cassette domain-containing protein [Pseudomonadota bacterium]
MITTRNLCLELGDKTVLDHISMYLKEGEILALCGPNGAGKTSLLAAIAGEYQGCNSDVYYWDQSIDVFSATELVNMRVVLEQNPSLSTDYTLEQLLEMGLPLALSERDLVQLKMQVMRQLGLLDHQGKFVSDMSGGQRHRAHFARVVLRLLANKRLGHDSFLFVDEPTASLDIAYQIILMKILSQLRDEGVGVLVVLHDLNLAAQFADRVILMKQGRIIHDNSPAQVLTEDALGHVFETKILVEQSKSGQVVIQPDLAA